MRLHKTKQEKKIMSNEIQKWLVIKTNKTNGVFTQVVEASELNEALNLAEENFDWERVDTLDGSLADLFYELCNEFRLSNIDTLPDDIQAFRKVIEDEL